MRFQYWTVNCLVFSLVSYTAFGCKRGDLQTAATTALISGCVGVGPVYFLQVSLFIPVLCPLVFALLVWDAALTDLLVLVWVLFLVLVLVLVIVLVPVPVPGTLPSLSH